MYFMGQAQQKTSTGTPLAVKCVVHLLCGRSVNTVDVSLFALVAVVRHASREYRRSGETYRQNQSQVSFAVNFFWVSRTLPIPIQSLSIRAILKILSRR